MDTKSCYFHPEGDCVYEFIGEFNNKPVIKDRITGEEQVVEWDQIEMI